MLSDITSLGGTRLNDNVFNGTPAPLQRTLRVVQFNQTRPQEKAWRTWRRFLKTFSDANGVLVNPLGVWTSEVHQTRHWPKYLYHQPSDTLMSHFEDDQYLVHTRIQHDCFTVRPTDTLVQGVGMPTATHIVMGTIRPVRNHVLMERIPGVMIPLGTLTSVLIAGWESNMLRVCQPLVSPRALIQHLRTSTLVMCSDGSVTPTGGRFGMIVSTTGGKRLMQGHGEVPGTFANSFRSEAYGVLATLRWLLHVSSSSAERPLRSPITHYLDNRSVILRINKALKCTRTIPNAKLLPDQDIIEAIKSTIQQLPVPVNIEWIQGHQDRGRPYDRLTLPAQLNCDADKQASNPPRYDASLLSTKLPGTPCQLIIQGANITGHLKQRVHDAWTIPRLRQYVSQRFEWAAGVGSTVDWSLHEQLLKKYKAQWPSLIKHIYGISPTGKIAHRNNPLLPHECPTCMAHYESNNHVIQCRHPSRDKWRSETLRRAITYRAAEVDPILVDILHDGMLRFHKILDPIQSSDYPARYTPLIIHQNSIGWDQVYRGRWAIDWSQMQDQYSSKSTQPLVNGATWLLGLGRLLLDQWFKVWKQRNEDRHHRDNIQLQESRRDLIHQEMRALYACRMQVCPQDRHLFYDTVQRHLESHPRLDQLEEWIQVYRPAIHASMEQAKRWGVTYNSNIEDFATYNPITLATRQVSLAADLPRG